MSDRDEISKLQGLCRQYCIEIRGLKREATALGATRYSWRKKARRLDALINNPHTKNFTEAVRSEAAHQRERWPSEHDEGKADSDWFWLIGYLAGKAIRPGATHEKRIHHIITTAAACLNWHASHNGLTNMRPGIDPSKSASAPSSS